MAMRSFLYKNIFIFDPKAECSVLAFFKISASRVLDSILAVSWSCDCKVYSNVDVIYLPNI